MSFELLFFCGMMVLLFGFMWLVVVLELVDARRQQLSWNARVHPEFKVSFFGWIEGAKWFMYGWLAVSTVMVIMFIVRIVL